MVKVGEWVWNRGCESGGTHTYRRSEGDMQARHTGDYLIFASKARRWSPYFCKQGTQVITLFLQARHTGYHLIFASKARRLSPYFCKQGTQVITYLDIILRMYTLFWECTHWCWGCKHYFEDVHIILRMYTLILRTHTFCKQGTQVITFTFTYLDIILKMYHLKLSRFVLICRLWTTSSPCSNFVMHDAIAKGRPDPRTHK